MGEITYKSDRFNGLDLVNCDYPLREDTEKMSAFKRMYVHNTFKHTTPDALLAFHQEIGFAGIGYHFAIAPDGTIFQTRPLHIQGAHVLGLNRESVGMVFLDVDICAASEPAKKSFSRLHRMLHETAGSPLPVYPHTYGQFEYLNALIEAYDESSLPSFPVDVDVTKKDFFAGAKTRVLGAILRHRPHAPLEKKELFHRIVAFTDALKVCPGDSFFAFVDGGEK